MHRFLHLSNFQKEEIVELSETQSLHLARVLRIQPGEKVEIFNGEGLLGRGEVAVSSRKKSVVKILSTERANFRSRIRLCFGIPKASALDFIIRRVTELGVGGFQPLLTRYSLQIKSWNEDRWGKVLVEVCKQCEELYLPELCTPESLDSWLQKRDRDRQLIHCNEQERVPSEEVDEDGGGFDLLVGPEGGWSAEEVGRLKEAGAISFGLGVNRLRVETASLVATVLLKQRCGELQKLK